MFGRKTNPVFQLEDTEFVDRSDEIIVAARKLRHSVLFRECYIHIVADLPIYVVTKQSCPFREDNELWLLLYKGQSQLRGIILQAHHSLMRLALDQSVDPNFRSLVRDLVRCAPEASAAFFRDILGRREEFFDEPYEDPESGYSLAGRMGHRVEKLLRSNLVLDQTGYIAGKGCYSSRFLCTELLDDDMPWDPEEIDW